MNLMAFKGMMEEQGLLADESLSGKEAIELVRQRILNKQQIYKLIMLDFSMPEINGPQTSLAIRELCSEAGIDSSNRPYICCVTAYSEADFKRQALAAGMDQFIIKPLRPKQVKKLLKNANIHQTTAM